MRNDKKRCYVRVYSGIGHEVLEFGNYEGDCFKIAVDLKDLAVLADEITKYIEERKKGNEKFENFKQ